MHGQDGRKSAVPLCQPSAQVVGLRLSGFGAFSACAKVLVFHDTLRFIIEGLGSVAASRLRGSSESSPTTEKNP